MHRLVQTVASDRANCGIDLSRSALEQSLEHAADDSAGDLAGGLGVALREVLGDGLGEVHDGHALQPDFAGAGEGGQEKAFAAEEDVAESLEHLDVERNHRGTRHDVAGMHEEFLAGLKIIADDFAGEIGPDHAGAGEALNDEPLAAEEPGAEPLLECDVERDAFSAQRNVCLRQRMDSPAASLKGRMLPGNLGAKEMCAPAASEV